MLWEHLVLDTLVAADVPRICYWRDKQQREIDFVVPRGRDAADAIECKWTSDEFTPRGLVAFRDSYPKGRNLVVTPSLAKPYERTVGGLRVTFLAPAALRELLRG